MGTHFLVTVRQAEARPRPPRKQANIVTVKTDTVRMIKTGSALFVTANKGDGAQCPTTGELACPPH